MAKASTFQNKMTVSNARSRCRQVSQARAAVEFARTQLGYATITSTHIPALSRSEWSIRADTVSQAFP